MALEDFGHESDILAIGPGHDGGTDPDVAALTGAVRQHPLALLGAALSLRSFLGRTPVDVVIAHGGSPLQAAVVATLVARPRPPIVYQLIMGMPLDARGPVWRRWWRYLLGRSAAVVSLTDELTAEIRSLGYRGPVRLVPNARAAGRFTEVDRPTAAARLRDALGITASSGLIGFVGHLVDQKRPDVAVAVLAELVGRGLDVHLVVVGGGPNETALRQQIAGLGAGDRVHLLGHRSDVEVVLGGLDLMVLTSDGEGMPGVAIEAQMAGCPVVSFPVGGVGEVIGHGTTGLVLDSHDVVEMADAVESLLSRPGDLEQMSSESRRRSERFSMERAVVEYHEVLTASAAGLASR